MLYSNEHMAYHAWVYSGCHSKFDLESDGNLLEITCVSHRCHMSVTWVSHGCIMDAQCLIEKVFNKYNMVLGKN